MLRIDASEKRLVAVQQLSLETASVADRFDLSELIANSPEEFFGSIGQDLFVVGRGVSPADSSELKIDVLAIDKQGAAVITVVEKRAEAPPLYSAIACAGIVSSWEPSAWQRHLAPPKVDEFKEFVAGIGNAINKKQRVILIAEAYGFEVLTAAEWLSRQHGIDILCIQASLAFDPQHDAAFLTFQQILPAAAEDPQPEAVSIEGMVSEILIENPVVDTKFLTRRFEAEVSGRQRAEEALQASEERYRILTRLSPVGIFHADPAGSYLSVNERWSNIGGLSEEVALGDGWANAVHPDDRERVLAQWRKSTRSGLAFKAEYRYQRSDGGTSWVLSEAAVQKDEAGKTSGYIGTITELHREEAPPQPSPPADRKTAATVGGEPREA
jgi:PAS domain S-box-containing protein